MGQLEDMQVFIRVVEAGGIGRAAEQLEIAKSAVSRRLSELETRLGVHLINRTTRTSSLTEAGQRYYEKVIKAVDYVTEINAEMKETQVSVSGTLRIAVPLSFGLLHLGPVIDRFVTLYPELKIQVDFSDRKVDLIEEGVDLAFRIADLKDASIQARRICPIHFVMVASPEYLEKYGTPRTPEDLEHHKFLKYTGSDSTKWGLTDYQNQTHPLNLRSHIDANNGDFLLAMAAAGHGILITPTFLASKALARGELVPLLDGYNTPTKSAYAIYPKNRYLPRRARLLIDFMVDWFGDTPYWDKEE